MTGHLVWDINYYGRTAGGKKDKRMAICSDCSLDTLFGVLFFLV